MERRALITGITGQDGSYLAELLIQKGYRVYGLVRRTSTASFERIAHLQDSLDLLDGDVTDSPSLVSALRHARPREVYNLAAQSFVHTSWTQPELTGQVTGLGVLRVLEGIRLVDPNIRFYQASSSEMFGQVTQTPQSEDTPFHPRSPYGFAKVYGHWATVNYRESYGLYAVSGILFNHESPRRGLEFVTRKITDAVARIHLGLADTLELGNLDASRDWGFAGDYVDAMWRMLQQEQPRDYVIGTGTARTVRDFLDAAFACVDRDWREHVVQNPVHFRPAEVDHLVADPQRARRELGWQPSMGFGSMVRAMVDGDLARHGAPAAGPYTPAPPAGS
jgi:GDPmannose 4,6-dehydratase